MPDDSPAATDLSSIWKASAACSLILLAGWASAIGFQHSIPPNRLVVVEGAYNILVFGSFVLVPAGVTIAALLLKHTSPVVRGISGFSILAISAVVIILMWAGGAFSASVYQMVYFFAASGVIGYALLILPDRLRAGAYIQFTLTEVLRELLVDKRSLLLLWLRYRIESRYAQTWLGVFWVVLLPLTEAFTIAFAFGLLLGRSGNVDGAPLFAFLLSGLAIFGVFRDFTLKAYPSLQAMGSLINRVYFPREIVVILLAGEIVVDFCFVFIAMIIINLGAGIYPNVYFLLLPIPILIVLTFSIGLAFVFSWTNLLFRDLQQLLTALMRLLFYVTVLFAPGRASEVIDVLLAFNPILPAVLAYRDITIYGRAPDLEQLYFSAIAGVVLMYLGYIYFKVNEDRFADLL